MFDAANATVPSAHIRRARMALGTLVEIDANVADARVVESAFAAISSVEAAFSFFVPSSVLAQINRAEVGDEIELLPWQAELLREAMELERASDGCFNANLGARLIALGLRPACFDTRDVMSGLASDGLEWVDASHLRVQRRVCLDLGGFAKGAAVDAALASLAQAGAAQACVNAGGDLAVIGEREVALRAVANWRGQGARICIENEALASSVRHATNGPFHGLGGLAVLGHGGMHLPILAGGVAIRAPRCALADALTKIVLVSGDIAHPLLATHGAAAIELE